MKNLKITQSAICLGLYGLLLLILSCAVNPVTGQRELMLLSEAEEIKLGNKTDAQIGQTYGIYDDHKLTNYINDLGQGMAKLSHRPNLPFEFKILDSPVVNAFAVPGGYVYLTRGILSYLNNEAELACIVGHEIGHITARHTAQQYTRVQLSQIGLGLGVILSDNFRQYAGLAQFGVGMLSLSFSRDNERQADNLGVEYATRAGFDAAHMAYFFETLERLHPSADRSGLEGWFSTHPNPPDRIKAVQGKAKEWAQKLGAKNLRTNPDTYLRQIDGLVFGEDPRQGYVDTNVFYHPGLKFQFPVPDGWKINNTPEQVQMVSKKQDAVILFSLERGKTPEEAANTFVAGAKARVITSGAITVNGLPAQSLISDINTSQGLIRAMSHFIQKDKKISVFHGLTSIALFQKYRPTFQATMSRFKAIADQRKINVKPDRLYIRSTRTAGTVKEALQSLGVPKNKLNEIALLNGKKLTDTIQTNTLLKVVDREK